ncbi:hypothetical protein TwortDSMZ_209 [Staphylococcus phage Twort]|uniref:Uncharacterized protein n=2 Tax=Staphylococcus phage Twort (strain DSM 17442 / HER 48) TaxID=2908167 RepID=A0A6H0X5J7_BPTWO|nr:TreN-like membrane protein [Staphylococcus phage Twort]AAX92477.1 ORF253 [Staphylococcus phage Twort]QIW89204.1 hypothetical protein TwortDSMZ_020 [Staphylococcus phage Twort]QIW89221.1 hypothetical protein TwortDSMZ_209 [Staphylococcus phage Twort]
MIRFKWKNKTIKSTEKTDNILISLGACTITGIVLKLIQLQFTLPLETWLR